MSEKTCLPVVVGNVFFLVVKMSSNLEYVKVLTPTRRLNRKRK